jgi:hypothetical protein
VEKRSGFIEALKEHKRWANGGSVNSIVLVVGLLSVTAFLADTAKADEATRIGMYIAMIGVIIVVCIWQAAACVAAAIESALRRRDNRRPWD